MSSLNEVDSARRLREKNDSSKSSRSKYAVRVIPRFCSSAVCIPHPGGESSGVQPRDTSTASSKYVPNNGHASTSSRRRRADGVVPSEGFITDGSVMENEGFVGTSQTYPGTGTSTSTITEHHTQTASSLPGRHTGISSQVLVAIILVGVLSALMGVFLLVWYRRRRRRSLKLAADTLSPFVGLISASTTVGDRIPSISQARGVHKSRVMSGVDPVYFVGGRLSTHVQDTLPPGVRSQPDTGLDTDSATLVSWSSSNRLHAIPVLPVAPDLLPPFYQTSPVQPSFQERGRRQEKR
ncbi:hypothetical protein DFP72DRAFT_926777 [Ephemerocybe angulata]|uniref:Uncharacterized protein n=1 Tax=Ephemerocybe angulata TaxID=980116 RepID=A0A8H6LWB0_9AGAR|nr:hypothetical protein DFP72DRAFT_926777 [Tulosesus angulatus]